MIFRKIFFFIQAAFLFFLPMALFAQGVISPPVDGQVGITNPINVNSIAELVQIILEGVIKIGIPVVALAIIFSGFLFVEARGNPEKLKTAKQAITYSLVGAALILGAWAISMMIASTILQL